jgi:superfamily II DNA or RNA helicase
MTDVLDAVAAGGVVPEAGQLVSVRDRRWVVTDVERSTQPLDVVAAGPQQREHLVTLTSVEDDAFGDELRVIWELEQATRVLDRAALPVPDPERFDDPARLDAFLDAVRWGAITSADTRSLQAPFRSGITIEDYQLDPVVRALSLPRANLLIADDVGLGKTIEAGLVVQELLLRHRARTVLVVCPASLCVKWRDEMAEKFGLEFRIVDAECLRQLRRSRGPYVNPWTHFPRLITSIDWLKRDRPMRLLRDVLPAGRPSLPRTFDLLIVDEVHGCAPSGRGRYATDSRRTAAIRGIAPHFEHRLFLSATPHNGYPESFGALLELLDDQRFARGVRPDRAQLEQVMVRRLKSELPPRWDGSPRFPERVIDRLVVPYSEDERAAHAALRAYAASRSAAARAEGEGQRVAADFVLTLLKKRLFSSPPAFASTLDQHLRTMTSGRVARQMTPTVRVLRRAIDATEEEFGDEVAAEEATTDALATAAGFTAPLSTEERGLLDRMRGWAEHARDGGDTKVEVLLEWLEGIVRPGGTWNDERVIVFTEYRDTQRWLQERLVARGLGGERLALLFGGMDTQDRERIKAEFQAAPSMSPVRILLATDAASEGIDLQRHCHRLVHYEIPWNPNRLEQRNGRIDRHGQPAREVRVFHFVGAGYEDAAPGSLEGDLQFLWTAVNKVEAIREDLGSVGPVIAEQVEAAMLGRRRRLDTEPAERASPGRRVLKAERDLRAEIDRLHRRLRESRAELRLDPANVERVVSVGLQLARQPGLVPSELDRPASDPGPSGPVFRMPQLTGSWARARHGLEHPVTEVERPVTFDDQVAAEHDDVVLVHLGHRLVQQCLRLLRAEIWAVGPHSRLARVTARVVPEHAADVPAVIAHGRLVVTGSDGHRLHEEVLAAGGLLREGRFVRLNVGEVDTLVGAATGDLPSVLVRRRLAATWERVAEPLLKSLERRAYDRADSLQRTLADRAEQEVGTITAVLQELRRSIEAELTEPESEQLTLFSPDERSQFERDLDALRRRLEAIPADIDRETAAIRTRYAAPAPRLFPAAVTFLVPRHLALA